MNGKWKTNDKYQGILRLRKMLVGAQIPHVFRQLMDGWQVIYPDDGSRRVMDAIEHHGSYGHEDDLLEIMGMLTPEEAKCDSVAGYLTAQNVFERIEAHWKEAR